MNNKDVAMVIDENFDLLPRDGAMMGHSEPKFKVADLIRLILEKQQFKVAESDKEFTNMFLAVIDRRNLLKYSRADENWQSMHDELRCKAATYRKSIEQKSSVRTARQIAEVAAQRVIELEVQDG